MTAVADRPAFTLRFRNDRTHRALKHAARELGVSMSELAERAIEHELAALGELIQERLERTIELLGSYRVERGAGAYRAEVEAFAAAEVAEDDPLQARAVSGGWSDALGVGAVFGDPVE